MRKNYVLDTNVLLHDPYAIFKFEDNDLILPIYVLEEIDQFKRETNERGRNARTVSRLLDAERAKGGSLSNGVRIGEEGTLRVFVPERRPELSIALNPHSGDHAILQTAIQLRDGSHGKPTIFVTMDVNLRIRADALGLTTEAYENQSVDIEHLDTGLIELTVTAPELESFSETGVLTSPPQQELLYANLCVMLRDDSPRSRTALGRYDASRGEVRALKVPRDGVMGIRPRNKEQTFALDLLLDDSVRLVTLVGKAGTGKTLLALAAGLKRTLEGAYSRLLVSRPVMPLGRDIGFLPGDIDEKLGPWMQPIFDNLEFLLVAGGKRRGVNGYSDLFDRGQLEVEPLTYIRGRSLPQQYVIVDEAQNLTPHEVKTVITRCGEGTKIVLTGDPFQIDNPYVDSTTNGLSFTADRLHGEAPIGHILLTKGERSELANLAANKL